MPFDKFEFLDLKYSTLAYYTETGKPKRYAPTRYQPGIGWLYALNPHKTPLQGEELAEHMDLCERFRSDPASFYSLS